MKSELSPRASFGSLSPISHSVKRTNQLSLFLISKGLFLDFHSPSPFERCFAAADRSCWPFPGPCADALLPPARGYH
ncbi:uncharacterized protein J3R85_010461 [Psidium guajava]|nr:uncharacterized protein J3R85_010461 [Psidium guajava]